MRLQGNPVIPGLLHVSGFQADSLQVALVISITHILQQLPLLFARPGVTFSAAVCNHPLAGTHWWRGQAEMIWVLVMYKNC